MVVIRPMEESEIERIGEIDRAEHVTLNYVYEAGTLKVIDVDWDVPRWFDGGDGDHTVQHLVDGFRPYLQEGGVMLGAFDGELVVGVAIFRPHLRESMAQLALLHVSRDYRRQGIASRLAREVYTLAIESGATEIYVSATPSGSAVGFYQSQGFRLAEEVNEELHALEPEDIHMIKGL